MVDRPQSRNSQAFANALFDISCPSDTSCFAVGISRDNPLVEQWDGSNWSMVANVPKPADATADLRGISCTSATSCLAVGDAIPSSGSGPLTEKWDGTAWSIVASPKIVLTSVSCWSSTGCFAVGSGYNRVLAWDGTKWSVAVSDPDNSLLGVSCSSSTYCIAVGGDDAGFGAVASAELWDGKHWSLIAGPKPSGVIGSGLSGVSCVAGAGCLAVGSYLTGISQWTLAERFS